MMVSLTLSVTEDFKKEISALSWVNWSEIAREEAMKKLISENFIRTGKISDDEWKFCESIDWHPVDEFPLKKEYIRKLSVISRQKHKKLKSFSEIFK
jgi:hypothetical protein